jgi:shikimate kinase
VKSNIVLIGFRGAGKSTVSTALSRALGWPRLEIDGEVRKRIGLISESVLRHGWQPFHDAEREVIAGLAVEKTVIDSGGGIVRSPENVERLARIGVIVLLDAAPATLVTRLGGSHERPMIGGAATIAEEVEQELPKRLPLYRAAADIVIETDGKSVEEIVAEIIRRVGLQ